MVVLSLFLLLGPLLFLLFIILINSMYQSCIPSWSFTKWTSLRLHGLNMCKFDISMVYIKQMVWEPITYLHYFQFTSREQSSCAFFRRKTRSSYGHSSIETKKVKKFKNQAAEPYLEPCQTSMMERFCENLTGNSFEVFLQKHFIMDVWIHPWGCTRF